MKADASHGSAALVREHRGACEDRESTGAAGARQLALEIEVEGLPEWVCNCGLSDGDRCYCIEGE